MAASAACASASAAPTGAFDPNVAPTGPLVALPDCAPLPEPGQLDDVDGLELPAGAVVTAVQHQDPIVTVTAVVPATPVSIRLAYEADADLEVLRSEDEVFEAELLVSNGTHRTALRATATCRDNAVVHAVVAPEPDAVP